MRVIGIDPSLTATGVAIVATDETPAVGCITSKPDGDTITDRLDRITVAARTITEHAIRPRVVDLAVIEAPAYASRSGQQHDRSGLWWAIVRRLHGMGVPVMAVPPTSRAKYATGRGNAGKDQVVAAVVRRYPDADVNDNNEADALVLAAIGARWLGYPIESSLPVGHLAAMVKLHAPAVVPAVAS